LLHWLAVFAFIAWLLALVHTILNLRLVERLNAGAIPASTPLVSIVVPARNEAHIIDASVRAFLAQQYPNIEVVVVNDRSTDATGELLRRIDDPRLTVVDGVDTPEGWLGKPWALQQGAMHAKGELLLFVDADVIYAPAAVRAAVADLESSGAAMVAVLPHFEMVTFAEHVGMPMLPFFAFTMIPIWFSNRSRSVRLGLGAGSGNLIRRDGFDSIGGFEALKDAVIDDVALAHLARRHGLRTRAVLADELLTVRMYHSAGAIVDGFTKNAFFAMGRSYVKGSLLVVLTFIVHLLPYPLALTGDWAAIASIAILTAIRVMIFRSARYPLWNALLLHPLMAVMWIYIFLRAMWITGVRRELRWRGRTYDASRARFGAER
jgi:chlorobactene glucosyltransferase